MDLQTGLVYIAVVVISAAVIALVSMFGIKEKSYEEAIAEQRKLPDDLLLSMYNLVIIGYHVDSKITNSFFRCFRFFI